MPRTVLTRNLRDTFHVRLRGPIAWPAARALLSMAVPLAVLLCIDRLDLLPGAVFGALTSVHCRNEPYPRQARTLGVVAAGMVAAVAAGVLIAACAGGRPGQAAALLGTALAGAVGTAAAYAVKTGPPGGLIFAFATGACAQLPVQLGDVGVHLLTTALCAAFAWAVSVLGAAMIGLDPQRRAVASALEATGAALSARADLATRHRAAVAVEAAWTSVALVGKRLRDSQRHRELVRAVDTCEVLLSPGSAAIPVAELRAAADAVRSGRPFPAPLPRDSAPAVPPLPESRWFVIRDVLRAALRPHRPTSWLLPYAARVGVAALVAGGTGELLGIGHSYWAAVSAVSVLQATSTATSVPRMLQRMAGTVFGVLLGLVALSAHPPVWMLLVLLAVLQWGAEMTVTINYAFGLLFATPVALLVSSTSAASAPDELAANRLWATVLGAAIAVLAAWAWPNGAWLSRVRTALAEVRALSDERPVRSTELRAALVELHEAHDVAAGEVRPAKLPTEDLLAVSHHAYAVLDGVPARR